MSKQQMIDVSTVEVPLELYPRASAPTEKDVEHLRGCSESFPPIMVAELVEAKDPGNPEKLTTTGRIVVVDGAHRLTAAILDGVAKLPCGHFGKMTAHDVLAEAIQRNATHGKQLTMRDKQRLAKLYAAQGWSNTDIRLLLAVGERTVTRWTEEEKKAAAAKAWKKAEKLIEKGASVSAAAKEVGVPRSTLNGWRDNPPAVPSKEPAAPVDHDTEGAAKSIGQERIDALVEIVVEFSKDSSNALSNACEEGGEYPHWTELAEAAIKAIRSKYPKEWRVR